MRFSLRVILLGLVALQFSACKKDTAENIEQTMPLPEITPLGFEDINFPDDNAYTQERWELGKALFFDPVLSKDSTVSCASCHNPSLAFSDNVAFSKGVEKKLGTRNSPTLTNIGFHPYFTREGGVPSLEMQVLVPIQEHNEFDFNILPIAERLNNNPAYISMSQAAYGRNPDPFVIVRAIATFERSLLSTNSAFDRYYFNKEQNALNESAKKGMQLFYSDKTNCSKCHSGFNFSNFAFENNGLYNNYKDEGRRRLTNKQEDFALFKVPTLRNVEVTAPYMHDGSLATLEKVIEHYNSGGKNNPQKSQYLQVLNLTETEKSQLVAFLKSLTDHEFNNNPKFKP